MIEMPSAWISFLLVADSYFQVLGVEPALEAFADDLTPAEKAEMLKFLEAVSELNEDECVRIMSHKDPVIDENLLRPRPCKAFYALVTEILSDRLTDA